MSVTGLKKSVGHVYKCPVFLIFVLEKRSVDVCKEVI